MSLENHVASLELSKKLVEEGIVLETYFFWHVYQGRITRDRRLELEIFNAGERPDILHTHELIERVPAPILTEVLEVLPPALEKTATWLTLGRQWSRDNSGKFYIEYTPDDGESQATTYGPEFSINPTNAAVKMLLNLKEKGLV